MKLIITSGLAAVRKEFIMKKNAITYGGIILGIIILASFFLIIIIPVHNAKADGDPSSFYGHVYFGVKGQEPDDAWSLYTKVIKVGTDSTSWHYQTINDHYNETAQFGYGTYIIRAKHTLSGVIKARDYIRVYFSGTSINKDIITVPEKEKE